MNWKIIVKTLASNPKLVLVKPSISAFMFRYLQKFRVMAIDGNLILHSHLPPLTSKAYARFVDLHLLRRISGPSHAQIGLTNDCPQNCEYCYNKDRKGLPMDTSTILKAIQDLKKIGIVWLGFTGGEPLLNRDIVRITEAAGDDIALKLFTTGCSLTRELASDLRNAGLFSVSVSLDHWQAEEHDRLRRYDGAFQTALGAIDIFKSVGGIHVGVSAVLSKGMLEKGQVEEFLDFLKKLGIHEAWLSEAKPSVTEYWSKDHLISPEEKAGLMDLQDRFNREESMTVNYLGHFESGEHFGCNAGHKMVYIDAFGDVSPCVFTPMIFGNIRETPLESLFQDMAACFKSSDTCFINTNFELFQKYVSADVKLNREQALTIIKEACFGQLPEFFKVYDK